MEQGLFSEEEETVFDRMMPPAPEANVPTFEGGGYRRILTPDDNIFDGDTENLFGEEEEDKEVPEKVHRVSSLFEEGGGGGDRYLRRMEVDNVFRHDEEKENPTFEEIDTHESGNIPSFGGGNRGMEEKDNVFGLRRFKDDTDPTEKATESRATVASTSTATTAAKPAFASSLVQRPGDSSSQKTQHTTSSGHVVYERPQENARTRGKPTPSSVITGSGRKSDTAILYTSIALVLMFIAGIVVFKRRRNKTSPEDEDQQGDHIVDYQQRVSASKDMWKRQKESRTARGMDIRDSLMLDGKPRPGYSKTGILEDDLA